MLKRACQAVNRLNSVDVEPRTLRCAFRTRDARRAVACAFGGLCVHRVRVVVHGCVASVCLFVLVPRTSREPPSNTFVFARFSPGHMLVANVAFKTLSKTALTHANDLINELVQWYPATPDFTQAACWADDLKTMVR